MSIFPVSQIDIVKTIPSDIIQDRGINFLFDFTRNEFILKDGKMVELVGDASVVFWIEKTLRTEYEHAPCYHRTDYGFGIERFIGVALPPKIVKLQFEDNVKKALLQHQRIKTITEFELTQDDDNVNVSFAVELIPVTVSDSEIFNEPESSFTRLATVKEIQGFLDIRYIAKNKLAFSTTLNK